MQIDLAAIRHNIEAVSAFVGDNCEVMAVVKANGYGHGLSQAAEAATSGGAAALGVATVDEGVDLRNVGSSTPIVVLGASLPDQAATVLEFELSQTVSSLASIDALADAAAVQDKKARVHLKVDTGMGRVGAYLEEALELLDAIRRHPNVELEGLATHVGWDAGQQDRIKSQIDTFSAAQETLRPKLTEIPRWTHAANSLVTVTEPKGHFNLVRVGLLTYGIPPSDSESRRPSLSPALSIHARFTQIRTLRPGQPVSYGGVTVVDRATRAAIIPVGYGDGYPRISQGGGHVLFNGKRCPILGVVCMDQFVVDVTDTDATVGDEVILLGRSGSESITVTELASSTGRIPYEIVAGLTPRLPYTYSA